MSAKPNSILRVEDFAGPFSVPTEEAIEREEMLSRTSFRMIDLNSPWLRYEQDAQRLRTQALQGIN